MTDLALRPATELAALLRCREVSSRELLEHHLVRIERLNPAINAVVALDVDGARRQAAEADAAAARGATLGPLHGVPITVKDTIETAGIRSAAGDPVFAAHVPAADAPAVARLRAAGAIVIGKTNVPWRALDAQTYNDLDGTTNNPWDLTRSPGGSSGGAAAAVVAGLAALELGSDTAGSVRIPAHACGVFGHKPSWGVVPTGGHIPPEPGVLRRPDLLTLGPLARSAADLDLALAVLAGPGEADAVAWRLTLPGPRHEQLTSYRVASWFDDPHCPVDDAVRARLDEAVAALRSAGVTVAEETGPGISLAEHEPLAQQLLQAEICSSVPAEIYAGALAEAEHLAHDAGGGHARWLRDITARKHDWNLADEQRQQLRTRWAEFFRHHDVLLTPIAPVVAIPHDQQPADDRHILVNGEHRRYWELTLWPTLANVALLPATVVPVGLTPDGLPAGIQLIGPHLEDRTPLALARHLEQLLGGFRPPSVAARGGLPELSRPTGRTGRRSDGALTGRS